MIKMKKILFILFLLTSISIYAESKFTFKGEIVDYDTKESLSGAVINLYSGEKLVRSLYSDKNGNFEFTIVNQSMLLRLSL